MPKTLPIQDPAASSWAHRLIHLIPSAAFGAGLLLTVVCAFGGARSLHAPALFCGALLGAVAGVALASEAWLQEET